MKRSYSDHSETARKDRRLVTRAPINLTNSTCLESSRPLQSFSDLRRRTVRNGDTSESRQEQHTKKLPAMPRRTPIPKKQLTVLLLARRKSSERILLSVTEDSGSRRPHRIHHCLSFRQSDGRAYSARLTESLCRSIQRRHGVHLCILQFLNDVFVRKSKRPFWPQACHHLQLCRHCTMSTGVWRLENLCLGSDSQSSERRLGWFWFCSEVCFYILATALANAHSLLQDYAWRDHRQGPTLLRDYRSII